MGTEPSPAQLPQSAEEGGERRRHMREEVGDKKHTQLIVRIHLGMDLRDRNADGHEQGEGFTCNLGAT